MSRQQFTLDVTYQHVREVQWERFGNLVVAFEEGAVRRTLRLSLAQVSEIISEARRASEWQARKAQEQLTALKGGQS